MKLGIGEEGYFMEEKDLILRNWQESNAKALYEMCCVESLRKSGIHFYASIIESQNAIQIGI